LGAKFVGLEVLVDVIKKVVNVGVGVGVGVVTVIIF